MAKTILLADDSVTIQKVVELTFMDEDYDVESVGSGTDALERLDQALPDLVIADVHMPGADGYRVCQQAKALKPRLPVLLLVGTFEPFDEARAAEVGADASLKKPFDSQDLLRRVSGLLAEPMDMAEAVTATMDRPQSAPAEASSSGDSLLDTADVGASAASADEAFLDAMADDEPPESVELTADQRELSDSFIGPDSSTEVLRDELADGGTEAEAPAEDEQAGDIEATAEIEAQSETDAEAEAEAEAADVEATAPIEARPEVDDSGDAEPEAVPEPEPEPVTAGGSSESSDSNGGLSLSDEDVDRIARRVAELAGAKALREVAWEVLPDLAEVVIKERIRELEGQVE